MKKLLHYLHGWVRIGWVWLCADTLLCAREHSSVTGIYINMHWHRGTLQSRGVWQIHVIVFFYLQINAIRSIVPNKSNNEIVLVLQQFDNNVDKAVQAFMDGKYNVPFSLMQEGFNHMPKYLLSLVAQNIFRGSSEIWCVTLVNYNWSSCLHLCFFTVQVWHGCSSVLPDCHFEAILTADLLFYSACFLK